MLKNVTIRELFLVILIVALSLAWLSGLPAMWQLEELQTATGHIRPDSDNLIYVRQLDSERSEQWRFKVRVPERAKYQYVWTYDLGKSNPLFLPRPTTCREGQADILVFVDRRPYNFTDTDWTTLRYYGNNSIDSELMVDSTVAQCLNGIGNSQFANRSKLFTDNFSATYDYDSGLHVFKRGESIQLLRLEGKHPETGKQLWIELNMVPAKEVELDPRIITPDPLPMEAL